MKLFSIILMLLTCFSYASSKKIYSYSINSSGGKEINLSDYKGKPLLIVNIATRCGFTPQLAELEELYSNYKKNGLVILGIPSNDFRGQTPESDKDIKSFCKLKYGVNFPLTAKTNILGEDRHNLITFLINSDQKGEIRWNFEKFLIDKNGKLVKRFRSSVSPLGEISDVIKGYL